MTPLRLAVLFHDAYERLAPDFGYETRLGTREFRSASPNGQLMMAVAKEVLEEMEREDQVRQGIADGTPLHQIEDALDQAENVR